MSEKMRNDLLTKRWLCCLALLCAANLSFSHSLILSVFHSPVDYEISLAGNFGEPRPNHFHGGLDIKTDGVEGKHIYAIADGYVSRVTVGLFGFGNAVYITHPTGHTSVYCHLKSFSPRIKAALRRYQYKHETCVADARLKPLDVPVSAGQFIALSGNTGHSSGPHLHLEVHDTRTGNLLDPYQFLNDFIQDTVPPQAHAIMAIPQSGGWLMQNGGWRNQPSTFNLSPSANHQLTAWGPVGFALWADDYMQGSHNHCGIHETLLFVDGDTVFHSVVDNIPTQYNRMVNSWGYYDHWLQYRKWYMKSYIEPGNRLKCLQANANRGIIDFNEERDYYLEYILRDFKGNEARYPFTVHAKPTPSASSSAASSSAAYPSASVPSVSVPSASVPSVFYAATLSQPFLLRWNRTNSYSRPGIQLIVPYGFVAADTPFTPFIIRQPDSYSDACQFADVSLPLMYDAELSIYVRRNDNDSVVNTFDPSKLYITNENGRFMGGDYHDGWVTGRIRDLSGRYEIAYDDQPPTVKPISLTGDRLTLSVIDGKSGIASWTATVDGRFIVFDTIEKSTTYACFLRESWLRRTGQPHRLRFEVTDNRRNTQIYESSFNY